MKARQVWALCAVLVMLSAGCAQLDNVSSLWREQRADVASTVLVVDSSASMAKDDAPGLRIDAAKKAATALINALPADSALAVVAYGSTTTDDPAQQAESCRDVQTVHRMGQSERADATATINSLEPGGFTPLGRALELAVLQLPEEAVDASIVVLSDGEDTCGDPTPCDAAQQLHDTYPNVTISTVGFKTDDPELACVAHTTGGLHLTADDVDSLVSRLIAAHNVSDNAATLTPTGHLGIELGQHFDDISAANPDFPDQSQGTTEGDGLLIHWVDCDWVFQADGVLTEIRPTGRATVDGLTIGSPQQQVVELYGQPVSRFTTSDGSGLAFYPASRAAGTAWKITTDSQDTVTAIVLCKCLDEVTGQSTSPETSAATPAPERQNDTAELPSAPPASVASECGQQVLDSADVTHRTLGAVRLFLTSEGAHGSCAIVVDGSGRVLAQRQIATLRDGFSVASPPTDASGNLFVWYRMNRFDGVMVLVPTDDGYRPGATEQDKASSPISEWTDNFFDAELHGPGDDGLYSIEVSTEICVPSCAEGTDIVRMLHWNGSEYVE